MLPNLPLDHNHPTAQMKDFGSSPPPEKKQDPLHPSLLVFSQSQTKILGINSYILHSIKRLFTSRVSSAQFLVLFPNPKCPGTFLTSSTILVSFPTSHFLLSPLGAPPKLLLPLSQLLCHFTCALVIFCFDYYHFPFLWLLF